jgi:hypothetical protein
MGIVSVSSAFSSLTDRWTWMSAMDGFLPTISRASFVLLNICLSPPVLTWITGDLEWSFACRGLVFPFDTCGFPSCSILALLY